ncbi:MAG: hypothetical protein MK033_13045 [Candidatus Caenarcaniphilales bacterium]|nr:hypothetical protein [Candidatus Caenarcaniphilales bacterium]
MFQIEASKRFRKKFSKLIKNNKALEEKISQTILQLRTDPGYASLKTHKVNLTNYGQVFSSYVTGDIRILWTKTDEAFVLLLLDVGGHEGGKGIY